MSYQLPTHRPQYMCAMHRPLGHESWRNRKSLKNFFKRSTGLEPTAENASFIYGVLEIKQHYDFDARKLDHWVFICDHIWSNQKPYDPSIQPDENQPKKTMTAKKKAQKKYDASALGYEKRERYRAQQPDYVTDKISRNNRLRQRCVYQLSKPELMNLDKSKINLRNAIPFLEGRGFVLDGDNNKWLQIADFIGVD